MSGDLCPIPHHCWGFLEAESGSFRWLLVWDPQGNSLMGPNLLAGQGHTAEHTGVGFYHLGTGQGSCHLESWQKSRL